jgi:hypothetical protein
MAPIYNPPASASSTDADEQYFTDLGLLTGLTKIVGATGGNTFPTPDDRYASGTAAAVSENILQWGAASADSWEGYDLGGTMTRVLTIVYIFQSTAQYQYLIHNKTTLDTSKANAGDDIYQSANVPSIPKIVMYKQVATTWTEMANDASIYAGTTTFPVPYNPAYGWAMYTSYTGGVGSQRMFLKFGSTSEWIPVLTTADTAIQEFKSVALWTLAKNERAITPFSIWGA